ncbi:hypothetical protein VNO77_03831 [Canavalia gladiata]|uniref:Uncharacterized protein n=1 Tax=Canavalia gladiata TaxID=3824 RepID=A0AAN9N134_CANGL
MGLVFGLLLSPMSRVLVFVKNDGIQAPSMATKRFVNKGERSLIEFLKRNQSREDISNCAGFCEIQLSPKSNDEASYSKHLAAPLHREIRLLIQDLSHDVAINDLMQISYANLGELCLTCASQSNLGELVHLTYSIGLSYNLAIDSVQQQAKTELGHTSRMGHDQPSFNI